MNNHFRFYLQKHKNKIALGLGIVVVLIAIIVCVSLLTGDDSQNNFFTPRVKYANYYIAGQVQSVSLYNLSGEQIDELEYEKVVYPNNLSKTMIVFADGAFYEITTAKEPSSTENIETVVLSAQELFQYENNVLEFIWNNEYFAIVTDENHVDIYDRNKLKFYTLENITEVDACTLCGNYFIYSSNDEIKSVYIATGKEVSISVGAETYYLTTQDESIIAFNRFGNGNNTTSIFILKPFDLYIDKLLTEKSVNVFPISSETCCFVKKDSNIIYSEINANGEISSNTTNMKVGEVDFTPANTLLVENYVYTNKEGNIMVISLKDKTIAKTFNIACSYLCPVWIEN